MGRVYLLDTDFTLKIAALDLFSEFLDAYSIQRGSLRVIRREVEEILRYKGSIIFSHFSTKKRVQVESDIKSIPHIAEDTLRASIFSKRILEKQAKLIHYENIDSGEVTLLLNACLINSTTGDSLIYTADHKCIQELVRNPEIVQIILPEVANKLLIIEQVLVRIINDNGLKSLLGRICMGKHCDEYLDKVVFANGLSSYEAEVIQLLTNRITSIHKNNDGLLYLT